MYTKVLLNTKFINMIVKHKKKIIDCNAWFKCLHSKFIESKHLTSGQWISERHDHDVMGFYFMPTAHTESKICSCVFCTGRTFKKDEKSTQKVKFDQRKWREVQLRKLQPEVKSPKETHSLTDLFSHHSQVTGIMSSQSGMYHPVRSEQGWAS